MGLFIGDLAEKVGFEPTVMLPPRLISSQVHSTTLPLLLHSNCGGSLPQILTVPFKHAAQ